MDEEVRATLWIDIVAPEAEPDHSIDRLRRVERGEDETRITYSFASVESLLETLTPNRWTLLEGLLDTSPVSLRALARKVGRDVRGVHADVHRLLRCGLLDRTETGQLQLFGNHDAQPEHGIPANRITQIHVDFTVRGTETKEAA